LAIYGGPLRLTNDARPFDVSRRGTPIQPALTGRHPAASE
jgi:hypothetical protein